jgi:hypothetical protein
MMASLQAADSGAVAAAPDAGLPRGPARLSPRQRALSTTPCRLVEWSVCATDTRLRDQSISRPVESYHDHGGHSHLVSKP